MPSINGTKVTFEHVRRAHPFHRKTLYELAKLAGVHIDTLKGYYRKGREGPLPETDAASKVASLLIGLGVVFMENDQVMFYPPPEN